jgi:hypothetical protein
MSFDFQSHPKGRNRNGLNFIYHIDDLGNIIETFPTQGGLAQNGAVDKTLGPWRKPNKPMHIDTPEKKLLWDRYWEEHIAWWEHERNQEFRDRTWR